MIATVAILERERTVEQGVLSGRLKLALVILGIVILALVLVQLVLSNFLAIQGEKISSIETQIKKIELENNILKSQIAQAGSIYQIMKKAEEQGLKKPQNFFFIRENFALSGKIAR